ncbi:hypothetical protein WOLCODRAFT_157479 [Wolfiporia cocos MD-104 SS10]|uniref:F-box domain-containing protein n=1 Tax=Wolfiporia cocos (strain MD-104) TaxID=742152 RepID=A0A2H3JGG8_WOLCO|nr:hypothetical protein WOLCODRAFT_157479 [Wolfiporia cocos MD-104 SS10]
MPWSNAPRKLRRRSEGLSGDEDKLKATNGARKKVRGDPSSALHTEAADPHGIEQSTQVKPVARNGVEGGNMLEKAGEAREVEKLGWRHIGRVPGAPDTALTESKPPSRMPQLPVKVCERMIDWLWNDNFSLRRCSRVCKAWTPRYRYWMRRNIALNNRSHVQGHARRARTQPHILEQARTVWVLGGANKGEQAPIPQLGTLAIMGAGKLPLVGHLVIQRAIWKPSDFHPLLFACLST